MIGDITSAAVASVAEQIRPYIRYTPVITVDRASLGLAPGPLALKLEQLRHSGSFKVRGEGVGYGHGLLLGAVYLVVAIAAAMTVFLRSDVTA